MMFAYKHPSGLCNFHALLRIITDLQASTAEYWIVWTGAVHLAEPVRLAPLALGHQGVTLLTLVGVVVLYQAPVTGHLHLVATVSKLGMIRKFSFKYI